MKFTPMKFLYYLDAVSFCRHNRFSLSKISKHGKLWNCYWTVSKPKRKLKGTNAPALPSKTT